MNIKLSNNLGAESRGWAIAGTITILLLISIPFILYKIKDNAKKNANEKSRMIVSYCLKNTEKDDDLRACRYYGLRYNVDHNGDIIITENNDD